MYDFVDYYQEALDKYKITQSEVDQAKDNVSSHPVSSNIVQELQTAVQVIKLAANASAFVGNVDNVMSDVSKVLNDKASTLENIQNFFSNVYTNAEKSYSQLKLCLFKLERITKRLQNKVNNPIKIEDFIDYKETNEAGEEIAHYDSDKFRIAQTKWEEDVINLKTDGKSYTERIGQYCSYLDQVDDLNTAAPDSGSNIPLPPFEPVEEAYKPKSLDQYMSQPEDESNKTGTRQFLSEDEEAAFKRAHNIPENEDVDIYVVEKDGKQSFVVVPANERENISEEELEQFISENFDSNEGNPIVEVNTERDNLNFRSSPGGEVKDSIPKGEKIEVIGPDENGWTKVRLADGREGYVSTSYLRETGENTDPIYTFSPEPSDGAKEIKLSNGNVGYVSNGEPKRNFNPSITVNTNSSNLNLRKEGSKDASIIGSLPKGTELEVIESDNGSGWVKVRTPDGQIGYVSSEFIKENKQNIQDSSIPEPDTPPVETPQTNEVATDTLNVEQVKVYKGEYGGYYIGDDQLTKDENGNYHYYKSVWNIDNSAEVIDYIVDVENGTMTKAENSETSENQPVVSGGGQ